MVAMVMGYIVPYTLAMYTTSKMTAASMVALCQNDESVTMLLRPMPKKCLQFE